jgi:AI-2 transport protein TqsA
MKTYEKINSTCLFVLTIFASATVLSVTKSIMVPFTLAIFVYLIMTPVMGFIQQKLKLHRLITLFITLLLFTVGFVSITILVSSSIDSFLKGAGQYQDKVQNAVVFIEERASQFGFNLREFNIRSKLANLPVFAVLQGITGSMINLVSNIFLVTIFALFLLTGDSVSKKEIPIFDEIKKSIAKYVSTKIFVSVLTGLLSYLVFKFIGVDLAIMFAMLAILLNFIPNVGSIIAVILPLPVLVLQFGFGIETFIVLIATTIIQIAVGNIMEPKLMGESMDLHPVTILLFLTFWGFIWGIPGMFLSVPITAALKIIFSKLEMTKPIAELFAGRIAH